jgi:valyl-tRNA synthetase
VLRWTLLRLLEMIHPFMPILVAEIRRLGAGRLAEPPRDAPARLFPAEHARGEMLRRLVGATRALRAESGIPARQPLRVVLRHADAGERAGLLPHLAFFSAPAGCAGVEVADAGSAGAGGFRGESQGWQIVLPLEGDREWQRQLQRLDDERKRIDERIAGLEARLREGGPAADARKLLLQASARREKIARAIDALS